MNRGRRTCEYAFQFQRVALDFNLMYMLYYILNSEYNLLFGRIIGVLGANIK